MPAWVMHLKTAKVISEKLKINKDEFFFGNVMVDAQNYVVNNLSINIPYDSSHFAKIVNINGINIKLPDYEKFYFEHKNEISNPIVLGYFVHLMTDYFWNKLTFSNYYVPDGKGSFKGIKLNDGRELITDKETVRILKQTDFDYYSRKIYLNINMHIDMKYKEVIYDKIKNIENIPYSKEDVEKIIKYVNNLKQEYDKKENLSIRYKVFTEEVFDKNFNLSIVFILKYLKKIGIVK